MLAVTEAPYSERFAGALLRIITASQSAMNNMRASEASLEAVSAFVDVCLTLEGKDEGFRERLAVLQDAGFGRREVKKVARSSLSRAKRSRARRPKRAVLDVVESDEGEEEEEEEQEEPVVDVGFQEPRYAYSGSPSESSNAEYVPTPKKAVRARKRVPARRTPAARKGRVASAQLAPVILSLKQQPSIVATPFTFRLGSSGADAPSPQKGPLTLALPAKKKARTE